MNFIGKKNSINYSKKENSQYKKVNSYFSWIPHTNLVINTSVTNFLVPLMSRKTNMSAKQDALNKEI